MDDLETRQEFAKPPFPSGLLLSQSVLSVGVLLAFFYNLSFMQANPSIGPLLTAFIEMLIDVAKFFFYFSFMFSFLAFTVSFTKRNMQYFTVKGYFESIQNQGNSTIDNDALMK